MTDSHPLVQRQRAYSLVWNEEVNASLSKEQKTIIGTLEVALVSTVRLMREEGVEYDMGRAIAAVDKVGAAIHDVRVAFALANLKDTV